MQGINNINQIYFIVFTFNKISMLLQSYISYILLLLSSFEQDCHYQRSAAGFDSKNVFTPVFLICNETT